MSLNYSEALKPYQNKGEVGMKEIFDSDTDFKAKIIHLAEKMRVSKCCVIYCGAGCSTSAGIPDFRGPKGVWTLEKDNKKSDSISFGTAKPTFTHFAIKALYKEGFIKYVVSQNVDGLFHRSGFPVNKMAEIHGNVFLEKCDRCSRKYFRDNMIETIGLKLTGRKCEGSSSGKPCRGSLKDATLDWEDELPEPEFTITQKFAKKCDLALTLGTSLQINPVGKLPLLVKKNKESHGLVTINLQATKHENKADIAIHGKVDDAMRLLINELSISVDESFPCDLIYE
uniref:Deacetylase sirtuin-type domain-containing protein n=1 Tax=Rhabditophanes sp. KR3021 TaxID=114890 RepID=A0AC35TUN8_9BILA